MHCFYFCYVVNKLFVTGLSDAGYGKIKKGECRIPILYVRKHFW